MQKYADKCTEGELTPEENSMYGACVSFGNFIAILKSKIRLKKAAKRR
jgi:hypothetical protein